MINRVYFQVSLLSVFLEQRQTKGRRRNFNFYVVGTGLGNVIEVKSENYIYYN